MNDVLLIGIPRPLARRLEAVLDEVGLGRLDAGDVAEASSLLAAMPAAAVCLRAESGAVSAVVEAISILPLTPSQQVMVLFDDQDDAALFHELESDQIGCFHSDLSSPELRPFLTRARRSTPAGAAPRRFGQMLGDCDAMRELYTLIAKVAPTDAAVLICGESGTGKELVANAIHRRSERADKPFVAVNCGAIAENLIESELFGHEKGAFTGAQKAHAGVFEQADGGTLFLDEITEMPMEMQVRLLRVLETGQVRRLGSEKDLPVAVRVIAATNRNPQDAVDQGRFREDLMFRLAVFPITLPPLRERGNDVQMIARYFLSEHNQANGTTKRLTRTAEARLGAYHWPGNVRQLRNLVHRAYIIEGESIDLDCLLDLMDSGDPVSCDAALNSEACEQGEHPPSDAVNNDKQAPTVEVVVGTSIDEAEKQLILKTMQELSGDKPEVAKVLGISLKTLYNRLNSYEQQGA